MKRWFVFDDELPVKYPPFCIKLSFIFAGLLCCMGLVCFVPFDVFSLFARKLAVFFDAQRLSAASEAFFLSEAKFIFKRLPLVFFFLGICVLVFSFLWDYIFRQSLKEHFQKRTVSFFTEKQLSPLLLFLFVAAALAIRLININQSLWFDEIYRNYMLDNFSPAVKKIILGNNHIFYSLISRLFVLILGGKEWVLRLPALLSGVACVPAIFMLREVKYKPVLFISAILLILSPAHIDFSNQARGYSGLILCAIISFYFFTRFIHEGNTADIFGAAFSCTCGIYFHLYGFFILLGYAAFITAVVFSGENRITFKTANIFFTWFFGVCLISALLYLPALPAMAFEALRDYPRQPIDAGFVLSLFNLLGAGFKSGYSGLMYAALFAVGIDFARRNIKDLFVIGLILFLLPLSMVALMRPVFLYPRFFSFLLPFYLIFVSCGIYRLSLVFRSIKPVFIQITLTIILFASSWPSLAAVVTTPNQDYRSAAGFVSEISDDNAIIIAPGAAGREIGYYLKGKKIVSAQTIEETNDIINTGAKIIFVITYQPTINQALLDFTRANFRHLRHFPGRISSVDIYAGDAHYLLVRTYKKQVKYG